MWRFPPRRSCISLSPFSVSLSQFVRGREGGDEQIHTTRLVAVKPRRSMSELFLIHYIHVNFSPLTQNQNQTTANDRRLSVLQRKLSRFIVELQLTDRKSKKQIKSNYSVCKKAERRDFPPEADTDGQIPAGTGRQLHRVRGQKNKSGIITVVCQFYSPRLFNHRVMMCDCLLRKAIIMTKVLLRVSGSVRLWCTFTHWKLIWWMDKKVAPRQSVRTFIHARVTYRNNVIRTVNILLCALYAVM